MKADSLGIRTLGWVLLGWQCCGGLAFGAITRSEFGSPPLRWNFDEYLWEFQPDQNPETRALRFHLGTTVSATGVQSNEWNSVRAAFGQWQSIPGVKIRFEEGEPRQAPNGVSALDGKNDVVWLAPGTYGDAGLGERIALGPGTIALTVLGLDVDVDGVTSGTIVEGDILVNRDREYLTDVQGQSSSRLFLESVVLHEIGHLLGMNHTPVGAATMWWYQGGGVGPAAGLSADEVNYARWMYGTAATLAQCGTLRGSVKSSGNPVLGALVFAERADGRLEGGTVTGADGSFTLSGLPAGRYRLRVLPLDPSTGNDLSLVRGGELDVSAGRIFANGSTTFLGLADDEVEINAGQVLVRNLNVQGGTPPFRITEIRTGLNRGDRGSSDLPVGLVVGQSNVWVGVYLPVPLPADTVMRITGDGLDFGVTEVIRPALRQMTLVQVPVTVRPGATPGLRSVEVIANGFTARAMGFVEVTPVAPDFNFDGLDDLFQRKYFQPFTRSDASPEADPDGDFFKNWREALRGTDPLQASSYGYRIQSVRQTQTGTTVVWESAAGRRYQLWSRDDLGAGGWVRVGTEVTATGDTTQVVDGRPALSARWYRVQDPP